jgi:hypothetical protein
MAPSTAFKPGHEKKGGRQKGVPDKRTRLAREAAATAIELLTNSVGPDGKEKLVDPISITQELIAILRALAIAAALGRKQGEGDSVADIAGKFAKLSVNKADLVRKCLADALSGEARLIQYRYPRLQQVDHKDVAFERALDAAAEDGTRIEYIRRIWIEPGHLNGKPPVVIEQPPRPGPTAPG